MCPTGSTLQIPRRDCRHRWTISPLPLNAERRLRCSTVLVATATIRVVATEGQIYGRQLQQAGDYTGPHRDPLGDTRWVFVEAVSFDCKAASHWVPLTAGPGGLQSPRLRRERRRHLSPRVWLRAVGSVSASSAHFRRESLCAGARYPQRARGLPRPLR